MRDTVRAVHLDPDLSNPSGLKPHSKRANNQMVFTFVKDPGPLTLDRDMCRTCGGVDTDLIPQI